MGYWLIGVIPMAISIEAIYEATERAKKERAYYRKQVKQAVIKAGLDPKLIPDMYRLGILPNCFPVPAIPIEVTFAYEPDDGENGEVHYVSTFDCIRDWAVMYWPNEDPEYCYTKEEAEF